MGIFGRNKGHTCRMCGREIYGEETVVETQRRAMAQGDLLTAVDIEQKNGYRCKACGSEYCKDCLEKKAPSNYLGGKSCPSCGGFFEVMHG